MAGIQLTDEFRLERGGELVDLIQADEESRHDWNRNRIAARNIYYGNAQRLDTHWEGASDIHLPVVQEKIESVVPRINAALAGEIQVNRVPQDFDPEETRLQQHYINWAVQYDIPDFSGVRVVWIRNMLLDGVSVVKTVWRRKWRRTCQTFNLKIELQVGQVANGYTLNAPQLKTIDDLLNDLFGQQRWADREQLSPTRYRLNITEDRRLIPDIEVEFAKSEMVDEVVAYVYRPIMVEDNPKVEVVEIEDLIVPYRAAGLQPGQTERVAHQHWMTLKAMKRAAGEESEGRFHLTDDDLVQLERIAAGGKAYDETTETQPTKDHKDQIAGIREPARHKGGPRKMLMYEVYATEDIEGEEAEVIYQISPDLRKIVSAVYLESQFPHGHRPFSTMHFLTASDRFYVPGMAIFLAAINIEVDTIINQVNDYQELINNPIFFYEPTAMTVDPKVLTGVRPGQGIPTNNPNGVVFPNWNKAPLANLGIIDSLLLFADRITVSPMTAGSPQVRNAPRTARGTLALLSEGNIKIDLIVDTAKEEGYKELLYQLFGLYAENMSDEKYFWVTGRDRKKRPEMVMRQHMRGKYEFTLTGTTTNSNPEVQRLVARDRYAVASTNPLYQNDPIAFGELLRDFLNHNDEGVNVDVIMPRQAGMGAHTHPPQSQQDELAAMRLGRPIDVLPSDDDAQHLAILQQFIRTPEYAEMNPEIAALISMHGRGHALAMQQKAAVAQTAQLNAGQANNVPQDMGGGNGGPTS